MLGLCLYTTLACSQLCTGSLGDPVVNITFGSGPNPGPPLPPAKTSYQYVTNTCPVNGDYTICNSGTECNYGWHVLQGDHSGLPGGYFMLVDASFEPGDFYVDTVATLCPNTTYEFAAWMLNLKKITQGIRPNITFSIETDAGVLLKRFDSGDIPVEPTAAWKQYGFYFTTPNDVSKIVVRMRNNARGGDGNDLAIDDITFRPCGGTIKAAIEGNGDSVHTCEGDSVLHTLKAAAGAAFTLPLYQWQSSMDSGKRWNNIAGATADAFRRMPTRSGAYWYRVAVWEQDAAPNKTCRTFSNVLYVSVHSKPLVDAGPDRTVLMQDSVHLNGIVSGEGMRFNWSPPDYLNDAYRTEAVATPARDMKYTLHATSVFGCAGSDAVTIKLVRDIFVPTAFTPNGDGRNDRWHIAHLDPVAGAQVRVYNRYGQVVYHARGTSVDWDGSFNGKKQPSGAYVYTVHFTNGRSIKGIVMLIR